MPLTLAGAGTGLTGASIPVSGAVLSLQRFQRLEIFKGRARCGAGVQLSDLHQAAANSHQLLGPNPTEISASVGGTVSTNASGARSFQYGSMRQQVLGVEATLMDATTSYRSRGDRVDFHFEPVRMPETRKNSAGYCLKPALEWVDLLAGSEGTLAVISEIELKLCDEPAAVLGGVVFFPADCAAVDAVGEWRRVHGLRMLEYMDRHALHLLRSHSEPIPPAAQAALLIEQNLSGEGDEEIDMWTGRLEEHLALAQQSWFGLEDSDRERFRQFRHKLPVIVTDRVRRNGFSKFGTDFAVPVEKYRELHSYYQLRCEEAFPDKYTIFGHIGDANVHVNLLPETKEEADRGEHLIEEFAAVVVSMGGTVAAEHGIGKTKTDLLALMYSPREIDSMKSVKRQLDPQLLLGQGTLFPV
jgi:FAD/FMN-containing dehydrogenase